MLALQTWNVFIKLKDKYPAIWWLSRIFLILSQTVTAPSSRLDPTSVAIKAFDRSVKLMRKYKKGIPLYFWYPYGYRSVAWWLRALRSEFRRSWVRSSMGPLMVKMVYHF